MKRLFHLAALVATFILGGASVLLLQSTTTNVSAQSGDRYFPETGQTVPAIFYQYWLTHGGLAQQGYPITAAIYMRSPTDGREYLTQYFQRARFEYHPEYRGTGNEVLLGLLGTEVLNCTSMSPPVPPPNPTTRIVEVRANASWQNTNIFVPAGSRVSIIYRSGQWRHGPEIPWHTGSGSRERCEECPVPDMPPGALIGRVGNQVLRVGNALEFTSSESGTLLLRMNDLDNAISNNDGSISVEVTVR